ELEWLRDKSALKVTIAYWYTPLRNKIEGTGLTPDIAVAMTDEDFEQGKDPQLERALEVVRGL
ncbi:MAG: hypothetical protein HYV77_02975, partial [Candidatus Wildermuthbacteria bacterium]|nr:hypothetical protein [Candidatus Wildermuthbacteria bacterium]